MRYSYFLAPAFYGKEDRFRTVGFSSSVNTSKKMIGCRYLWPNGQPMQVEQPSTPSLWVRKVLARIPDGEIAPDGIYAHISLQNTDPTVVTPSEVILVVDDEDAPAEWERITVAIMDPAFWEQYGSSYIVDGNGIYFSSDYRATACIPEGREGVAPPTWTRITADEARARHPNMEI